MINVYHTSNMSYTPFCGFHKMDLPFLKEHGISIVDHPSKADIIVSQHFKQLKKYFLKFGKKKKYLIWTLEPRFNVHTSSTKKFFFGQMICHVMNIYTGDIFVSPLSFHIGLIKKKLVPLTDDFIFQSKKIIGLMSFYKGLDTEAVLFKNKDVDLIKKRVEIALYGHKRELIDIYGKGWPDNISREDSREGDWVDRKKFLMSQYDFNLCFENTAAPRYCTEKIWDSIENYCLPIYYGEGTDIYELFPKDSFIDYSTFNSPKELCEFIESLTNKEFIRRMNLCIKVYNSISSKNADDKAKERAKALTKLTDKLKTIHNSNYSL